MRFLQTGKNRGLEIPQWDCKRQRFKWQKLSWHRSFVLSYCGISKPRFYSKIFSVGSDCWYTIELLLRVLKSFNRATKAISNNGYSTIGLAFFIFRLLGKDFLSKIVSTNDLLFNYIRQCSLNRILWYNIEQNSSQTKTILVNSLQYISYMLN